MVKRILFLEHNTDGTIGGSHVCLLDLVRHLDRQRYEPFVCFFQRNTLVKDFEESGVNVLFEPPPRPFRHLRWAPRTLRRPFSATYFLYQTFLVRLIRWLRLLRERHIDLVHLNNACGFDFDLMMACLLMRTPYVIHERGIQRSISRMARFFADRAGAVVAISDAVRDNLLSQGVLAERVFRVDDGIDDSRIVFRESPSAVRQRLGIPSDAPLVGIVGNVKFWKGQHVVIDAIGYAIKSFPSLRCLFVGSIADHGYHRQLLARALDLGLPMDQLVFTGYEPHPVDLVNLMNIVIHASVEPEPFGIVLLDAMASAKPVIATDMGGPREIVIHGSTGVLVPPNDAAALAGAICRLLGDQESRQRMGALGRARFLEQYTIARTIASLDQVYRLVCHQR